MKKIEFPDWLESETISYIADFFFVEYMSGEDVEEEGGEDSFFYDPEIPPGYLISPDLRKVWSKAKKRYPDKPAKGQIELFRMIECSFPEAEANWTTKRQAELWQKQFLATLNKLERLWAEMPSNLLAHVDDSQNMFRADELYKNGSGVSELKSVIEQLQCVGPIHGRQTVGQKAEKLDFMRELSGEFKIATGKWMRADVATITSVIYGVSVNPPDVVRATKGMATPGPSNTLMRILHSNEPKTPSQN